MNAFRRCEQYAGPGTKRRQSKYRQVKMLTAETSTGQDDYKLKYRQI